MSVWLREILGWVLLGIGLAVFLLAYQSLQARRIFDCLPLTFIGYTIFRGGLHLIKVATAARIARQTDATPAPKSATMPLIAINRKYAPVGDVVPGSKTKPI